jgi:hypothetical protein
MLYNIQKQALQQRYINMKKIIKANGNITFVNEKYLDAILEEGDVIDENYVVDKTPPAPTAEEIQEDNQRAVRDAAKKYLADTDWYATRKAETGKAIPEDVLAKRAQARTDASE